MIRRREDPTRHVPVILSLHATVQPPLADPTTALAPAEVGPTNWQRLWSRRPVKIFAVALCACGIGVAVFGGTASSSSSPTATPLNVNSSSPRASALADIVPATESDSRDSEPRESDPRDVVRQMLRQGELGPDVMNWRISEPVVESRNGDIVLVRITEASSGDDATGASIRVLLVRQGDSWNLRDVTHVQPR